MCRQACAHVWKSVESALCFHHVGYLYWTQSNRLGSKCLYPLSNVACPYLALYLTAFKIQSRAVLLLLDRYIIKLKGRECQLIHC